MQLINISFFINIFTDILGKTLLQSVTLDYAGKHHYSSSVVFTLLFIDRNEYVYNIPFVHFRFDSKNYTL